MKLTNKEIYIAREPLRVLLGMKLPIMVSYKLAKLAKKLDEQLDVIEKVRQGLIDKYVTKNEQGRPATKLVEDKEVFDFGGKEAEFQAEFADLLNIETELVIEKVRLPEKISSTCDKCNHNMDKPLEIESSLLLALDKFVEV